MEIYPLDWPRLSGTLNYGFPHPWKLLETEESVAIVPADVPYGAIGYFVVLGLTLMAGVPAALTLLPNGLEKAITTLIGVAVGLALIFYGVAMRVGFSAARARGPILVISFAKNEVSLPREHKTWLLERVVRWDIAHGWWARSSYGKPYIFSSEIAELQMVVRDEAGKETAWPIIGGGGPRGRGLAAMATTIARRMRLPMEFVDSEGPM